MVLICDGWSECVQYNVSVIEMVKTWWFGIVVETITEAGYYQLSSLWDHLLERDSGTRLVEQ